MILFGSLAVALLIHASFCEQGRIIKPFQMTVQPSQHHNLKGSTIFSGLGIISRTAIDLLISYFIRSPFLASLK